MFHHRGPTPAAERLRLLHAASIGRQRAICDHLLGLGRNLACARKILGHPKKFRRWCRRLGLTAREGNRLANLAQRLSQSDADHFGLSPLALLSIAGPEIPDRTIQRVCQTPRCGSLVTRARTRQIILDEKQRKTLVGKTRVSPGSRDSRKWAVCLSYCPATELSQTPPSG